MNSSQSSSIASENECKNFFFQTVPLRYSSVDSFYGLLVAAAVLGLAACPFTIFLNALVIIAVKIKRRLQTHPNILLACLALTDLMAGLVAQPLHITKTILLIQGKDFHEFCDIDLAFSVSNAFLVLATSCHLVLISGERYLAIKHTFTHATVVTKARLIVSSAVAWMVAALFFLVVSYLTVIFFACPAILISTIVVLQILVYKEARRHEKQILSQQVSVEARAKFKQEKKALKLTSIILVTIFLCFLLPSTVFFFTWQLLGEKLSPDIKTLIRHFGLLLVMINSLLNPIIYTVRKEEFRVAFTELLLRKSLQEAEDFQRRLFGTTNNAGRQQDEQQGEGQEQNIEERNPALAQDNQDDNPEVLATGANVDDNTTIASHDEPVSSNALNSICKKRDEEYGDERNPAPAKNNIEDNPEVLASRTNFDGNTTLATNNESVSLNALNSMSKTAEEEHDERRSPAHAENNLEDNPEVLAFGTNFDGNTTLETHNEAVSLNELNSMSKTAEEEHDEGRSPGHAENNLEDNPEVLASGTNFDGNTTLATHNEAVSLNALNSMSKTAEEEHDEGRNLTHTKYDLEDNPEALATGADVDDNTTLATHKPVSSNALNNIPKKTEEEHGKGRNLAHTENNLEDNPEVIANGASIDLKNTENCSK